MRFSAVRRGIVAAVLIAGLCRCSQAQTVSFAGYTWDVKTGSGLGPGPNDWGASNVFVDGSGLHLLLNHAGSAWTAAEVSTQDRLGFGTYTFDVTGQVDQLDQNVVLGLFNYGPPMSGPDGTNEIDVEYAQFGNPGAPHGNFTVWPANSSFSQTTNPFAFTLSGNTSTSSFVWDSQSVQFSATDGFGGPQIGSWTFAPVDYTDLIPQQTAPVHMNLWLFQGNAPTDGQDVEIIINGFTFTPASAPEPTAVSLLAAGTLSALIYRGRRRGSASTYARGR